MLNQFWILFVINVVILLRLIVINIFNLEEKFIKKKNYEDRFLIHVCIFYVWIYLRA